MTKKGKIILASCIAGAVVLAGVGTAVGIHMKANSKPVSVYSIYEVGMTNYWGDSSETEGRVTTDNMQSIYVSESQTVLELFVQEGQEVKKGDPLVSFDTTLTDIELERQRLTVEKTKDELSREEANYKRICTFVPYVPPVYTPSPEEAPLPAVTDLPHYEKGKGPQDNPIVFLIGREYQFEPSIWSKIYARADFSDVAIQGTGSGDEGDGGEGGELPPAPDPGPGPEPDPGPAPDPDPGTDPDPGPDPGPAPAPVIDTVYVVFVQRSYTNPQGKLQNYMGMKVNYNPDGSMKSFGFYDPDTSLLDWNDDNDDNYYVDYSSGYSAAEIAQMKSESLERIRDLGLKVKQEEVKYELMQLEMDGGVVTAKYDGVIKSVLDYETALAENSPLILLSGGGGYYITGNISELDMANIEIGQSVDVYAYWSNCYATGSIVEISQQPVSNYYGWSNGNNNVSWYPFTVFVSDEASFRDDEYASITLQNTSLSNSIYLQTPFVLTENARSYVYVSSNGGPLEKREVATGRNLWGSYIQILGGLSEDDCVAFPYGKQIREGAPTVVGNISELYEGLYY